MVRLEYLLTVWSDRNWGLKIRDGVRMLSGMYRPPSGSFFIVL